MTTYKKTGSVNIKSYSSDPPNASPSAFEGQLYYNSTDGLFKYQTLGAGAWASGGALNLGRSGVGGAGIQTAVAAFGGYNTAVKNETEQ